MKRFAALLLIALAPPALAEDQALASVFEQAASPDLSQFLWTKRPVVVFADSPFDPAFTEQIDLLKARAQELEERDVIVLTDTDPATLSDLRRQLRPRGFMLVLIGKDGDVKLRKPFPWDVRALSRAIDKMPIRQQEIRRAKEAAASE